MDALLTALRHSVAQEAASGKDFCVYIDRGKWINGDQTSSAFGELLSKRTEYLKNRFAPNRERSWLDQNLYTESVKDLDLGDSARKVFVAARKHLIRSRKRSGRCKDPAENSHAVDYALSVIFGAPQHLAVFDFGSAATPQAARSLVVLSDERVDDRPEMVALAHLVNRLTSALILFEYEYRTFRLSVRSHSYVLKRDERRWQRIQDQIHLYRWACDPHRLPQMGRPLDSEVESGSDPRVAASLRLRRLLPDVQDALDAQDQSAYRMVHYPTRTFRQLILHENALTDDDAAKLLSQVLREMKDAFYSVKMFENDRNRHLKEAAYYTRRTCWEKFEERLAEARRLARSLLDEKLDGEPSEQDRKKGTSSRLGEVVAEDHLQILSELLGGKSVHLEPEIRVEIPGGVLEATPGRDPFAQSVANKMKEFINEREKPRGSINVGDLFDNWRKLEPRGKDVERSDAVWRKVGLVPEQLCLIHGDLHLDNVLIDPTNPRGQIYKLIDPANTSALGADRAYDIGKLLHSVHGFYDLIHEGFFKLDVWEVRSIDEAETTGEKFYRARLTLGSERRHLKKPLATGGSGAEVSEYRLLTGRELLCYLRMSVELPKLLAEKLGLQKKETDALLWRASFHEAMHFLTMPPFHMEEDVTRSLAIFITGIVLFADWQKSKPEDWKENSPPVEHSLTALKAKEPKNDGSGSPLADDPDALPVPIAEGPKNDASGSPVADDPHVLAAPTAEKPNEPNRAT